MYGVIKNNVFHNEPWRSASGCSNATYPASGYTVTAYNGKWGHRNLQVTDDFKRDGTYNLIEGNRIGHGSANPNNDGADNLDLATPKSIARYNYLYNAMNNNLMFKYSPLYDNGANGGINCRVYNNTIYRSGYGYPSKYDKLSGIYWYHGTGNSGNVVKNNIVYDSASTDIGANSASTIVNNWLTSNGDPKFTNPVLTDPMSLTLPDLSLQSSSGAIDGGTYLTQANGAGTNSTRLIVYDALYFQDGTWGSSLARGVSLFPDWIAIGQVANVVQISSINYSTNTITLASPVTWSNNANIWLYKKSDGAQVLHGSAPDYGAYEYDTGGGLNAPSGFRIIQ
jgi:hypothetical protein